jgi:hypothetical protein
VDERLDVTLTHNSVIVKHIQLGEQFSNIAGDLLIDRKGRVQIVVNSVHSFYINVHELPVPLLQAISKQIEKKGALGIVSTIQKKLDQVVKSRR